MSDSFYQTQTLTGHSFAAPCAILMKSSTFESPKSYLFALDLKDSIAALSTFVRMSGKVPVY